ncbi:hypothetical protein [Solitalea koreensis]|uniref:Uncharacterized protein n=1 Tax=Solitalea koreensis TaxID=543615 RepID=A0A521CYH0_9SPHI|nr:hypothetical protein [Solitalea koreensis]SMO64458.1 hypothetical protein SAMN06265350_10541 [Solitalea koreensis]
MKKFYLILTALFLPIFLFAQNLSGTWSGILNQKPGGYSEKYTYELIIKQNGNQITGISRTYIATEVIARLMVSGNFDHHVMNLSESAILEEVKPLGWVICIKTMGLLYMKKDGKEYLQGSWAGIGTDGGKCSPGAIFLTKINQDTTEFQKPTAPPSPTQPITAKVDQPSTTRSIEPVKTLLLKNRNITVTITDYGEIDDDTITVFLNKKEILTKERISKQPIRLHLQLTQAHNELLLYAENLGRIPPNTSILKVTDGLKTYRIIMQSSFQKSGAINLNLKPIKE